MFSKTHCDEMHIPIEGENEVIQKLVYKMVCLPSSVPSGGVLGDLNISRGSHTLRRFTFTSECPTLWHDHGPCVHNFIAR